jgi:hypothetical protein
MKLKKYEKIIIISNDFDARIPEVINTSSNEIKQNNIIQNIINGFTTNQNSFEKYKNLENK